MSTILLSLFLRLCAASVAAYLCFIVPVVVRFLVTAPRRAAVEGAYFGIFFALGFAVLVLVLNGLLGLFLEPEGLRRGVLMGVIGVVAAALFVVGFVAARAPAGPVGWVLMAVIVVTGALATSYFAATELSAGPLRSSAIVVMGLLVLFLVGFPLTPRAWWEGKPGPSSVAGQAAPDA